MMAQWVTSNPILAWAGSLVIAVPAVWAAIMKFSPKIRRIININAKLSTFIEDFLEAAQDHQLTTDEIQKLKSDYDALQAALK